MSKYSGEKVLVINRSLFDELGTFNGHRSDDGTYFQTLLRPENNFFMDRAEAEDAPAFKQIIPYAVFTDGEKILAYERGKSGGENRLHAKLSLGIGGHINPIDAKDDAIGEETYFAGLHREFHEELQINCDFTIQTLGIVNDDSNDVGKVHLGVIHLVKLDNQDVSANEEGIANLTFFTLDELLEDSIFSRLESWSQIAVDLLKQANQ